MEPRASRSCAQFRGVGDVAVVGDGDAAFVAVDGEGLRVALDGVAGGGVAGVADGERAGQTFAEHRRVKMSATWPIDFLVWISVAVAGGDAGAFLAAVLQRVEGQIGQFRSFGMAVDGGDTALFVKFIEVQSDQSLSQACFRSSGVLFRRFVSDRQWGIDQHLIVVSDL